MDTIDRKNTAGVRLPAWARGLSVPEKHQLKIALDTVENPSKALLGGPSVEEAEEIVEMLRGRAGGANASRIAERIAGDEGREWYKSYAVVSAAKDLASGLRAAADRLDRLESLVEGSDAMALPELIDVFLDAMSGVESRMFYKKQLLDEIRHPRPGKVQHDREKDS